jgi:hypothetical protein
VALAGSSALEHPPRPLQGALVEKPDPIEVNPERGLGDLLLVQQEEKVRADLLFTDLVSSAAVVLRQLVDGGDITRRGCGGQASEWQVFQHTASKGRHRDPPVRGAHQRSQKVDTNQEDIGQLSVKEAAKAGGPLAGQTRELPRSGFVQLLNIWKCFHIILPTALREMWISSSVGAAYMEIFQHHSPNTDLRRRELRPHGQWQATA